MSSSFTTRELGAFVSSLPDDAEILVVANAGEFATMYWTSGVVAAVSPSKTPTLKRWAHDMLAGFTDAMGGSFPGDVAPPGPPVGRA